MNSSIVDPAMIPSAHPRQSTIYDYTIPTSNNMVNGPKNVRGNSSKTKIPKAAQNVDIEDEEPANEIETVINPLSKRKIKKNGSTHEKLMKEHILDQEGNVISSVSVIQDYKKTHSKRKKLSSMSNDQALEYLLDRMSALQLTIAAKTIHKMILDRPVEEMDEVRNIIAEYDGKTKN
ncbi:hypothetical protein HDU86_000571 [Geranomyces michiganensis]|nr:hypothetical protein HDU86_000571 [Geranomyces michiganensis]